MLEKLSPSVIGYALNVVGVFFLASAITFKKPRRQIEELLGTERPRSLHMVREQLVNQIQTYIGFVILVAGFVLLMGEALNRDTPTDAAEDPNLKWIFVILFVATAGTTAVLKIVQLGYVRRKFRRMVSDVVRESKFNLEKNPALAVQIGELLRVKKLPDESVQEYIVKVKSMLGVDATEPTRTKSRMPYQPEPPRV